MICLNWLVSVGTGQNFLQKFKQDCPASLSALLTIATQRLGGVEGITSADWQDTFDLNVTVPLLMVRVSPLLESAGGSVVNVGSIHARLTKPRFVSYATSRRCRGADSSHGCRLGWAN